MFLVITDDHHESYGRFYFKTHLLFQYLFYCLRDIMIMLKVWNKNCKEFIFLYKTKVKATNKMVV